MYYGPISESDEFGIPDTRINYVLTSSHNCVITGRPITITLTISTTTPYVAVLPTSIVDIQLEAIRTFYWSDTVSAEERLTSVKLVPETPLTLQWVWTADPKLVQSYGAVSITPLVRFRDVDGSIGKNEGSYISIPVDDNGIDGVCQMP